MHLAEHGARERLPRHEPPRPIQVPPLDRHQVRGRDERLADQNPPVRVFAAHPHQQLHHLAQRLLLPEHQRRYALYPGTGSRGGSTGEGVDRGADQHVREADVHVGRVARAQLRGVADDDSRRGEPREGPASRKDAQFDPGRADRRRFSRKTHVFWLGTEGRRRGLALGVGDPYLYADTMWWRPSVHVGCGNDDGRNNRTRFGLRRQIDDLRSGNRRPHGQPSGHQ
ncbi:hypothetical protein EDB85DRAFT_1937947 [Lactarius pseudohatsudake]|nr:hypothetical protein EDB85DRAFT_1937947 [Lactarius pseudohatsudake]